MKLPFINAEANWGGNPWCFSQRVTAFEHILKYCDRERKYVELALALAKMCSFDGKLTSSKLMAACPVLCMCCFAMDRSTLQQQGWFCMWDSPVFDGCVEFRSTWGNLVLWVDELVKERNCNFFIVEWAAESKSQDSFENCHAPKTECATASCFLELWRCETATLFQSNSWL